MSVARNCSSLALAGGAEPIFIQIWQPRTPLGFAFDVGVVESAKLTACCKRLVCCGHRSIPESFEMLTYRSCPSR